MGKKIREIKIRKMRAEAARSILEDELNAAFMAGEDRVRVIHGIGEGILKRLTEEVVREYDFVRLAVSVGDNPGETLLDVFPPDKSTLRMLT